MWWGKVVDEDGGEVNGDRRNELLKFMTYGGFVGGVWKVNVEELCGVAEGERMVGGQEVPGCVRTDAKGK